MSFGRFMLMAQRGMVGFQQKIAGSPHMVLLDSWCSCVFVSPINKFLRIISYANMSSSHGSKLHDHLPVHVMTKQHLSFLADATHTASQPAIKLCLHRQQAHVIVQLNRSTPGTGSVTIHRVTGHECSCRTLFLSLPPDFLVRDADWCHIYTIAFLGNRVLYMVRSSLTQGQGYKAVRRG